MIDHGHNYFQTYVDVGQFPHDPNLTINIILRALQKAAEINVSIHVDSLHDDSVVSEGTVYLWSGVLEWSLGVEYWSGVESNFGVDNGLVLSGWTAKPQ